MQDPKWIGTSPSNVFWSYDSKKVNFNWNPEEAAGDSVYQYRPGNPVPVKLQYQEGKVTAAIHNGEYDAARTRVVFEMEGDLFLLDTRSGDIRRITQTAVEEKNPSFIMEGEWIAFQQENDLFAWHTMTGIIKQLARFEKVKPQQKKKDPQDTFLQRQQLNTSGILKQRKEKREIRNAYLEKNKAADTLRIIYTGDKLVRGQRVSPDGRFITYSLTTDSESANRTNIPTYVTESGYTSEIKAHSKVGTASDSAVFYIFDRERDSLVTLQIDSIPGIRDKPAYLDDYPAKKKDTSHPARKLQVAAVFWNDAGSAVVLDIRARDFKDRWLMLLHPTTGKLQLLDRQHDDAWIGGPGIAGQRPNAGWVNNHTFYYQSEESGYSHVYTQNIHTLSRRAVTAGKWEVQRCMLSKDKKYFYLTTNEEHPGRKGFFRVNTDGQNKVKITSMPGAHEVSISPDEKYIAYRYSDQNKPWELFIQENVPGKKSVQITTRAASDEWSTYPWRDTKIFSFPGEDGLPVYARIYEPAAGKKNNAAVIFVHGAGYLQNVSYSWSSYFREYMFNNLLADKGYTVLDIDYRASAGYGRDWRTGIYRHMGGKDLSDQIAAATLLVKEYGIDSARIGMYGGSYGGFITLMALFTHPGIFKAGAALRPVTDWAHYNNNYTAAILNEPVQDSIAYHRSSPIHFAEGLQDHLLICHGMVDVNVHYQDAVRLTQRLIELGKENWELASYPLEDHGFVEPSSWTDEYNRILKLFDATLLKP